MIRTQLQAVSTTTGAGKVFAQLAINIVITHMANSLLHRWPLCNICFTFCRGDGSSGVLFGALLFGFGFRLAGSASMTNAKRASD
jgi:hypothetical protein